eukprot:UN01765
MAIHIVTILPLFLCHLFLFFFPCLFLFDCDHDQNIYYVISLILL